MSATLRPLPPTHPGSVWGLDRRDGLDGPQIDADGLTLDAATVEAIAERVAMRTVELLRAQAPAPRVRLIDATALASMLGCSRQWVYANAEKLGGERLGDGPRPRLRFDPETARKAGACLAGEQSHARNPSGSTGSPATGSRTGRRSPNRAPKAGSILAVRGRPSSKRGAAHA
jgi:hypothetical protein